MSISAVSIGSQVPNPNNNGNDNGKNGRIGTRECPHCNNIWRGESAHHRSQKEEDRVARGFLNEPKTLTKTCKDMKAK